MLLRSAAPALAAPHEVSIDRLLALPRAEKTLDAMTASMDPLMHAAIPQAFGGKQPTPAQLQAIDAMVANYMRIVREEISPAAMRQTYLSV